MPVRTLVILLLAPAMLAAFAPSAQAAPIACAPEATAYVTTCVTAGDGCSVGLDGNPVATCLPDCNTPECADPEACTLVAMCVPDVPLCWNGTPLHDGAGESYPACWGGAGTKACGPRGDEAVYAYVLIYGTGVGCIPAWVL